MKSARQAFVPGILPLLLLLGAGSLGAQADFPDLADDPFAEGAFDAAVEVGKSNAAANELEWTGGVNLFLQSSTGGPSDFAYYQSLSSLGGKVFLKASQPELGALYVGYNLSHTLLAASNNSASMAGYRLMDTDFASPSYSLSELHLSLDVEKVLFIRLGTQLLAWGASSVWSPADFVNVQPFDSQAGLDSRAGKPGVRLHLPFEGGNIFTFVDFSRVLASGSSGDLAGNTIFNSRLDGTILGWNLGLQGRYGPGTQPRLGLTATGRALSIDLWGEGAFDLPTSSQDFAWRASAGGQYDFGPDKVAYLRGEYYHQSNGSADKELGTMDVFLPLYLSQDYLSLTLGSSKLGSDVLGASVGGIVNATDRSFTARGSLDFRLPRLLPFSLIASFNGGPDKREFTRGLGQSWKLEFRSLISF